MEALRRKLTTLSATLEHVGNVRRALVEIDPRASESYGPDGAARGSRGGRIRREA